MRRTAAEAAETRRAVLDAALSVFAEQGWDGATFQRIAARAGLTRGAVHHHFRGGKDELLRVLLVEQWQRYGAIVLAPLHDPALDAAARLRTFVSGHLALLGEDEAFRALATVTTLVAPHAAGPTGAEDHASSLDGWRAALRAVLEPAGVRRTGIDAETAVFVLVNVVVGVNATAALEPDRLPAGPAACRAVADAVVAGLTVDGH